MRPQEPDSVEPPRGGRSPAQVAGGAGVVWGLIVMVLGLAFAVIVTQLVEGDRRNGYCESIDHPGQCSSPAPVVATGLVVAALGLWTVIASVALVKGRSWGRRAVVVTFSGWSLLLLVSIISGLFSSGSTGERRVLTGLLLLAVFAGIIRSARRGSSSSPGLPAGRGDVTGWRRGGPSGGG